MHSAKRILPRIVFNPVRSVVCLLFIHIRGGWVQTESGCVLGGEVVQESVAERHPRQEKLADGFAERDAVALSLLQHPPIHDGFNPLGVSLHRGLLLEQPLEFTTH